jgi:Phage tail lysozyme
MSADALFASTSVKVMQALIARYRFADFQAAGFLGNIGVECNGFRTLQEIKPVVAGSKGGYGWCQWTGPRRRDFFAWCQQHGVNPSSYEANLGFLFNELDTDYARVITALRRTRTVEDATDAVCRIYLAPGNPHLEARVAYARRALQIFRGQTS